MTAEARAYELLKWQALAPLSEFDESYPYLKVWREYSDAALDAGEKEHPYEPSSELAAFRELERLGVFTQSDFYLPSKAADGYYNQRLKDHTGSFGQAEEARRGSPSNRTREHASAFDAQPGIRPRNSRGRKRC